MAYYYNYNTGNRRPGFLDNIPPVTRNLLIINVLMFIFTLVKEDVMITVFAMFFPASRFFHFWQVVTHMFMHGGFAHILFNMYALVMFGSVVERALGSKKFLVFYFVTGLGAVALHTGVQYLQAIYFLNIADPGSLAAYHDMLRTPTLGASGAIFGLLVGFAMIYPDSILTLIFPPISLKAKWFVLIYVAIELLLGVNGFVDGVAHFAHLGGALFGWIMLRWWKKTGRWYERDKWI